MFKLFLFFALFAIAFAVPKPDPQVFYSSPAAYSAYTGYSGYAYPYAGYGYGGYGGYPYVY